MRLEITRVAVRNMSRERDVELADGVLTRDTHGVVVDPDVDLVVEVIGGIEPARGLIVSALRAGKPVVTANKELLANVGTELFATADECNVDLLFEAAVAGGIPLVRVLRESLRGEPIRRVMGIVNGTTNYILTKMTEEGADYGVALGEAQRLGYAERDPTADVEGFDAGAKAAIIATIAFGATVVAGDVYHEGISGVTAADIAVARQFGYVVKLLGIADQDPSTRRDRGARAPGAGAAAPSARQRARELQRGVRRGRRRRLADVLRARRRRAPDRERGARRRDRRRRQPDEGHARLARLVRQGRDPPDRRDQRRVPARPRGHRPAGRAARGDRRVRPPRRQHPRRSSRRGSATTPGSCSSPTRRARPTCRRPCASCATSTWSAASVGCCA